MHFRACPLVALIRAAGLAAPTGSVRGMELLSPNSDLSAKTIMDDGILVQTQAAGGLGYGGFVGGGTAIVGGASNSSPDSILTVGLTKYVEGDIGVGAFSASLSRSRDADGNWVYGGGRGVLGPAAGAGVFGGYAGSFALNITPKTLWNVASKGEWITWSLPAK